VRHQPRWTSRSALCATSRGGLPRALFSDTARHFQNHVVEQLETALGLEHGASIAYAAWTNGACERAGRTALRLLRAVEIMAIEAEVAAMAEIYDYSAACSPSTTSLF
jgi:hypothetical protein